MAIEHEAQRHWQIPKEPSESDEVSRAEDAWFREEIGESSPSDVSEYIEELPCRDLTAGHDWFDREIEELKELPTPVPPEASEDAEQVPLYESTGREPAEAAIENAIAATMQQVDRALTAEEEAELARERRTRTLGRLAQHLLQSGNNVDLLLTKATAHPDNEQYYLGEAAVLACATLQQVWRTRIFFRAIRMLAEVWDRDVGEIDSVFAEFDRFLEIERKLLIAIGMSETSANRITMNCREVLESARAGIVSPRRFFEAIAEVTRETCETAGDLRQRTIQASERERAKRRVVRAGQAIFGIGFAALNASVFAAGFTSPLPPAMAAVSSVFGAELIKAALRDS